MHSSSGGLAARAQAAGRAPAGASTPPCGTSSLEHKRTLPLKAGPGSFKRLLGSVPSTDADYYAPSSAAAASCRAGRHTLQSAEELLTSTATTVRRRSN